jgi:hypothetical protein
MKFKYLMTLVAVVPVCCVAQLHIQKGAGLYLQENAALSIRGDLETNDNIGGRGSIVFNGLGPQQIDAHNYSFPDLQVQNASGIILQSGLKINKQLVLASGQLILGQNNIELGADAAVSGNSSAYLVTDGEGKIIKSVRRNLDGFILPVGTARYYAPVKIHSSGAYQNGTIAIQAKDKANPNKPLSSKDYLDSYWTINRSGINGDVMATAIYNRVFGNEENIKPYFWDGHQWINRETSVDIKNKRLNISIPEGSGEMYAMRKGDELFPDNASMTLIPNPVKNSATMLIRSNENKNETLRIYDNAGNTVITQRVILRKGANQVQINVMSLPSGQYIISSTQPNSQPVKMIKQ